MTERDKAKLIDNLTEAAAILRWSRYDVPLAAWRDDAAAPDYLASVEHVARALLESVAASAHRHEVNRMFGISLDLLPKRANIDS